MTGIRRKINCTRSWKEIKMVRTSLTLQTTSSVPSFKWRRRVVSGGVGVLRQQYSVVGEEYRAMTRSDMATLHGWTNFALWAKKISRNIPAVSSVYWRPTTCPVRSSSSSSRPECHSSWTNTAYPAVLGVSSARGLTTARLPVYLGWWTFQFTFLCRLGGFCNNARAGEMGLDQQHFVG